MSVIQLKQWKTCKETVGEKSINRKKYQTLVRCQANPKWTEEWNNKDHSKNKLKARKLIEKINKTKSWYFEKINKTDEHQPEERNQIKEFRNERRDITMETTDNTNDLKRLLWALYAKQFGNSVEMDKFL